MTRHETLLYAAGLFDGEGSISLAKTNKRVRRFKISVTSTSFSLVNFMQQFGGNIYNVKQRDNRRIQFEWAWTGKAAAEFIKELRPYLIEQRKRARADIVADELLPLMTDAGISLSDDMLARRVAAEEAILAL